MKTERWLACGALLLLAACASERVVLLPSADGRPGAVVVRDGHDGHGELLLDRPYAAAEHRFGENRPYNSSPGDVQARFGDALSAQPPRPASYTLYFLPGGSVLTPESEAEFVKVREEIARRPVAEVMVIGHTDRVGSVPANDELSLARAREVREQLLGAGVPGELLEAVGRGERDPLVPTADEVAEERNRRVEINVR